MEKNSYKVFVRLGYADCEAPSTVPAHKALKHGCSQHRHNCPPAGCAWVDTAALGLTRVSPSFTVYDLLTSGELPRGIQGPPISTHFLEAER